MAFAERAIAHNNDRRDYLRTEARRRRDLGEGQLLDARRNGPQNRLALGRARKYYPFRSTGIFRHPLARRGADMIYYTSFSVLGL